MDLTASEVLNQIIDKPTSSHSFKPRKLLEENLSNDEIQKNLPGEKKDEDKKKTNKIPKKKTGNGPGNSNVSSLKAKSSSASP